MNNMNFMLPFYGKKGTIKDIKEDSKYYLVYRYGLTENEETIFYVPKNNNNLELLLNNYYKDLDGYLDANSNKYKMYKKSRLNKKINYNAVIGMFGVSSLLFVSSIPLINSHELIGFLGVLMDTIAIPTAGYAIKELIDKKRDEKKELFIKEYNNLSHKLQSCDKKDIIINKNTIYQGLSNDFNKDRVNDLSKTKVLKSESKIRNVA